MPGHRYTQAEYALQQVVELFGNLLFSLTEHNLTHIYQVVFRFVQLESHDFLVLPYLNTGLLPFEEFSEDLWYDEGINIYLQRRRSVVQVQIGSFRWAGTRSWVLGQDEERKRYLDGRPYLFQ